MGTHLTELLVSTAEFSNLLSFLAVLGGLLVMMSFIIKLIYQDIEGGGGVTRVTHRAPQTRMARVPVPFTVAVGEERGDGEGVVLKTSSQVDYSIRYCWGVDIPAFHHVLRAPWPWFHQVAPTHLPLPRRPCMATSSGVDAWSTAPPAPAWPPTRRWPWWPGTPPPGPWSWGPPPGTPTPWWSLPSGGARGTRSPFIRATSCDPSLYLY